MFTFMVYVMKIVSSNYILFCTSQSNSVRSLKHHRSDALDGQAVANVNFFFLSFFTIYVQIYILSFILVFSIWPLCKQTASIELMLGPPDNKKSQKITLEIDY